MACCGLCRSKVNPTIKTNRNITKNKMNTINKWIENIESPSEFIALPSKPSYKPKIITNKQEIAKVRRNQESSEVSVSTNQDKIIQHDSVVCSQKVKSEKHKLQYLSSDLSINEATQSTMSENDRFNHL